MPTRGRRSSGAGSERDCSLTCAAGRNGPSCSAPGGAASWAIRFYEGQGFRLVSEEQIAPLLRRFWKIPDRQLHESVVMGDARWFARSHA
jgi:hypothetical protein